MRGAKAMWCKICDENSKTFIDANAMNPGFNLWSLRTEGNAFERQYHRLIESATLGHVGRQQRTTFSHFLTTEPHNTLARASRCLSSIRHGDGRPDRTGRGGSCCRAACDVHPGADGRGGCLGVHRPVRHPPLRHYQNAHASTGRAPFHGSTWQRVRW